MYTRYILGIAIGITIIIAMILFGKDGISFIALLALRPLIMRLKKVTLDERELALFHKANSISLGILLGSIIIFYLTMSKNANEYLTPFWFGIFVTAFVIIQSIVGFLFLKFK